MDPAVCLLFRWGTALTARHVEHSWPYGASQVDLHRLRRRNDDGTTGCSDEVPSMFRGSVDLWVNRNSGMGFFYSIMVSNASEAETLVFPWRYRMERPFDRAVDWMLYVWPCSKLTKRSSYSYVSILTLSTGALLWKIRLSRSAGSASPHRCLFLAAMLCSVPGYIRQSRKDMRLPAEISAAV